MRKRTLVASGVGAALLVGCVTVAPTGSGSGDGSSAPARDADANCSVLRIYLLRGFIDIFSTGVNELTDKLRNSGFCADERSNPTWPELHNEIVDDRAVNGEKALILGGHSYGGDDAIYLAQALGERGIEVDLMLLIDATNPPPLPSNVKRCVHWYIPTPLASFAFGNPVVAAEGNDTTVIENYVFLEENLGPGARGFDHFTLDSSPLLHELVIAEVEAFAADDPDLP